MAKNRRIFISDIHMGDERSMQGPHPYCWFNKNIPKLAKFLDDQLNAGDLKEVVILGDLFDQWVIPTDEEPLLSYEAICSNPANAPVVDKLKALAKSDEIKLAYVPGNHDMSMDTDGIAVTRRFLESTFPGILFFCNNNVPLGSYNVGTLTAEHGDRYCLFNAPDTFDASDTFLPLGYFISRVVAHKVRSTGSSENYISILFTFLKNYLDHPEYIPDLFMAIAEDAGLNENDVFKMTGVPGFPATITLGEVAGRFGNLIQKWDNSPGKAVDSGKAIVSDTGNLWLAANSVFHLSTAPNINIVIFGHTHIADINRVFLREPGKGADKSKIPCRSIYANCGSWVDQPQPRSPNPRTGNVAAYECTYVETELSDDQRRHYVRLKSYTDNELIDEGFVEM